MKFDSPVGMQIKSEGNALFAYLTCSGKKPILISTMNGQFVIDFPEMHKLWVEFLKAFTASWVKRAFPDFELEVEVKKLSPERN